MHPEVQRVLRYIARWGVPTESVRETKLAVTDEAPYGVGGGIHWPSRTIIVSGFEDVVNYPWGACLLLHELSHVLDGTQPDNADEVGGPILALDRYGARYLRLSGWSDWMSEFLLYDNDPAGTLWTNASTCRRGGLLQASLTRAYHSGLLDRSGRPTFNAAAWRTED